MAMFVPSGDGGVSGQVSPDEAHMLRALVSPLLDLLADTSAGPAATGSGSADEAALFDELERSFSGESAQPPEDPVLARLLPDAYTGDPEAAGEFRKFTESSLREAKKYFAQMLLETLPEGGGPVRLTGDQARDWMRALNDVRLMFGVRLDIGEDYEEQMDALDPDDPLVAALELYGWLGAVQESLVQALVQ